MYQYKNEIFALCSDKEQRALELFCYEINNCDADIFVVMAHKAVRLFQVLLEQQRIHIIKEQKIIISNQALGFDSAYLIDKKIAVVDDIIISGTSISNTVNKLMKLGVSQSNISIIALAIDREYFRMDFRDTNGRSTLRCKTELEDADCIELSYTISKTFSYYGLPYDIDFPIYQSECISNKEMLFNSMLWETELISNDKQIAGGVESYVLFPKSLIRGQLWNRIGINFDNNAHLKIRIYIVNYPNERKVFNVVPMCLFNEIYEQDLDNGCCSCDFELNSGFFNKCDYISKLRYLQFFIAHQLFNVINEYIAFDDVSLPDKNFMIYLFGDITGKSVYKSLKCCNIEKSCIVNASFSENVNKTLISEFQSSEIWKEAHSNYTTIEGSSDKYNGYNSYLINNIIFSPFLWWYDNKEIPVRNELKTVPLNYVKDYDKISELSVRLKSGFNLQTLRHLFTKELCIDNITTVVSMFLDRAIDDGIIVPTLFYDKENHLLSRAYRHGEDLPFGIQDQCRLLIFLKAFNEKIEKKEISEIPFEKIIVLFYQIGLKKGNIFNRFLGFNNSKIIKSFLCVHGVIEALIDSNDVERAHVYSEKSDEDEEYIYWLTKWLADKQFVQKIINSKKNQNDSFYYTVNVTEIDNFLKINERSSASEDIVSSIKSIAEMISLWFNTDYQKRRKVFKDDITALTSCSDIFVFSSAIATEIHYFAKFWNKQIDKVLHQTFVDNNNHIIIYDLLNRDEKDKKTTQTIIQGLYSGIKKYKWYNGKEAKEVVKKVGRYFHSQIEVNAWNELWEYIDAYTRLDRIEHSMKGELVFYTVQAVAYLCFFSICFEYLKSEKYWLQGNKPSQYGEYKDIYTKYSDENLFDIFDNINIQGGLQQSILRFYEDVQKVIIRSEECVSSIEKKINQMAIGYTIRYKSALILDIQAIDDSSIEKVLLDYWDDLDDDLKLQINIIAFPPIEGNGKYKRYGIFSWMSDNSSISTDASKVAEQLIQIYKDICDRFNAQVYKLRAILIPELPTGFKFEHNLQRNIADHASKFTSKILAYLVEKFDDEKNKQLILALIKNVDSEAIKASMGIIKWHQHKPISANDTPFTEIELYWNEVFRNNRTNNIPCDSLVKIKSGNEIGTGFLLRIFNQVVCISCNHVFSSDYNLENTYASTFCDNTLQFELSDLYSGLIKNDDNELLSAKDEVAVLIPQWGGDIPIDIDSILSFDKICTEVPNNCTGVYKCGGYLVDGYSFEQISIKWEKHYELKGFSEKGYCSADAIIIDQGFSGGMVLTTDDTIIGIHEGRFDDDAENCYMIPCNKIRDKIEELIKNE